MDRCPTLKDQKKKKAFEREKGEGGERVLLTYWSLIAMAKQPVTFSFSRVGYVHVRPKQNVKYDLHHSEKKNPRNSRRCRIKARLANTSMKLPP